GDCLLAAGIQIDKMYGRPGMAYIITFDNRKITLPGTYGEAPQLLLNNQPIDIDHPIKHGDKLIVEKGKDGEEPHVRLKEIIDDYQAYSITFNGESYLIEPSFVVNEKRVMPDYILQDHDQVTLLKTETLADWLEQSGKKAIINNLSLFTIYLDGQKIELKQFSAQLKVNGKRARLDQPLIPNDEVTFSQAKDVTVEDLFNTLGKKSATKINVTYNGKRVTLTNQFLTLSQYNHPLEMTDTIRSGANLSIQKSEDQSFIFQDLFRFISIDLSKVKGNVEILKNDEPATFLDPLEENDRIEINF